MSDARADLELSRVRIWFEKTTAMRYTGHLDLHRAWERTFRRARLPLAYSQGFNPRPKLNLASALPLGFTSKEDAIDAWLEIPLSNEEILSALVKTVPPGIVIHKIEAVNLHAPATQTEVEAAEYQITLLEPLSEIEIRIKEIMAVESLVRTRRGKEYNLRPLILELKLLEPDKDGHEQIFTRLCAMEGATGRPEELIEALGSDPLEIRVVRTKLIFKKD